MRLLSIIILTFLALTLQAQEIREIVTDSHQTKELSRYYNFCIGAGRANEGLRAEWQKQLTEVKRECGFRYIRFHGLFHDDMGGIKKKMENLFIISIILSSCFNNNYNFKL